jgi:hypothetical protein
MPRRSRIDAYGALHHVIVRGIARYIHLNPFRAGLVKSIPELERHPYCGHSRILGKQKNDWQDSDSVSNRFAESRSTARSLLCYWAVRECGMAMTSLARRLGLSITAVSQFFKRGKKIAKENVFDLFQ